ncbi:MAG: hypothetical protein GTO53_12965 [Planctomycetales bacterium]|nr:hypothetical protein [Planctomycetales bacterium]NIM10010.1 hypothetical protein [Planctomycetales bacterium]NIP71029.1 hypothetical protein [Planctomycetales bacterium]
MLQSLEAMPAALWIERLSIRAPVKPGELLESEADVVIFAVNRNNSD